jgi:hypothetical protein
MIHGVSSLLELSRRNLSASFFCPSMKLYSRMFAFLNFHGKEVTVINAFFVLQLNLYF